MNNQYEEAREWYDANCPCCIRLDIDWTCRGYDYPENVVEWIQNDTTNWKKLNDVNGGTYEYFARIDKEVRRTRYILLADSYLPNKNTVNLINYYPSLI